MEPLRIPYKPLRIPYKLQEGLTVENGPISIEGFNRKFPKEPLWKISRGSRYTFRRQERHQTVIVYTKCTSNLAAVL
eukprot:94370-Chlamydomonas_euryale.AAC.2